MALKFLRIVHPLLTLTGFCSSDMIFFMIRNLLVLNRGFFFAKIECPVLLFLWKEGPVKTQDSL